MYYNIYIAPSKSSNIASVNVLTTRRKRASMLDGVAAAVPSTADSRDFSMSVTRVESTWDSNHQTSKNQTIYGHIPSEYRKAMAYWLMDCIH